MSVSKLKKAQPTESFVIIMHTMNMKQKEQYKQICIYHDLTASLNLILAYDIYSWFSSLAVPTKINCLDTLSTGHKSWLKDNAKADCPQTCSAFKSGAELSKIDHYWERFPESAAQRGARPLRYSHHSDQWEGCLLLAEPQQHLPGALSQAWNITVWTKETLENAHATAHTLGSRVNTVVVVSKQFEFISKADGALWTKHLGST